MKVRDLPSPITLQGTRRNRFRCRQYSECFGGIAARLHEFAPSMLCPRRCLASGSASEKQVPVLPSVHSLRTQPSTHGEALQTISWQLRPPPPAIWSQIQRSQSLKIVGAHSCQMTRIWRWFCVVILETVRSTDRGEVRQPGSEQTIHLG